jgi:hypothetical protein
VARARDAIKAATDANIALPAEKLIAFRENLRDLLSVVDAAVEKAQKSGPKR